MLKSIAQTISTVVVALTANLTMAQNTTETFTFKEFADLFQKNKIELPTSSDELLKMDYSKYPIIDCELYNYIVIRSQKERAKRRTILGEDFIVKTYGIDDCSPSSISYNDGTKEVDEEFYAKKYALGYIENNKYNLFIVRYRSVTNTIMDLYVFDKDGVILSFVSLYEDEGFNSERKERIDTVYIRSKISNNGIVNFEENRYGVNVKVDYQLMDDGVLKDIKKLITGQYEVVDKDGYVNVRERPDGKSKVLYTIESGSVVKASSESGSKWFKVISVEGNDKKGGYIHSSRLANYW